MQNRIRLFIDKLLSLSKKSFYMYDFIYLFFFADSPQRTNPMIFLYLWNSAKVCSYKEESTARIKSYQFCLKSVLPRPLLTRMMPQNMISFLMGKPVTSVSLFMEIGPRYVHLVTLIIYLFFFILQLCCRRYSPTASLPSRQISFQPRSLSVRQAALRFYTLSRGYLQRIWPQVEVCPRMWIGWPSETRAWRTKGVFAGTRTNNTRLSECLWTRRWKEH